MLNILFILFDLLKNLPMMADNILLKFIFLNVSSFNDYYYVLKCQEYVCIHAVQTA